MDEMTKYQTESFLKDRYGAIFKNIPSIALSNESLEKCSGIIAGIIEKHQDILEERGVREAQIYLIDVVGYYVLLGYDIQQSNLELLDKLEELMGIEDDN